MSTLNQQLGSKSKVSTSARLGAGSWTILAILVLLLAGTVVVVYRGWILGNGTDVQRRAILRWHSAYSFHSALVSG